MAAIYWTKTTGGDWSTGSDWTGGVVPGAGDDVTIQQISPTTIAISTAVVANSLTLATSQSSVTDTGALTLTGPLNVGLGAFNLNTNGNIVGGAIIDNAGNLAVDGGTLTGVAYQGRLNLKLGGAGLTIVNGITFTGVNGVGHAQLNTFGSAIRVQGTQTLSNVDIGVGVLSSTDPTSAGAVLTIAANSMVSGGGLISDAGGVGDGIVNAGAIHAGSGGVLFLTGTSLTNIGTVIAENGPKSILSDQDALTTNTGVMSATNGASLRLTGAKVVNNGQITGDTGGQITIGKSGGAWTSAGGTIGLNNAGLFLDGAFTTADIGTVSGVNSALTILGQLDNTGATLSAGSVFNAMTIDGAVKNGTIAGPAAGVALYFGTLDGVSVQGALDLSAAGAFGTILHGVTLSGAGGVGKGAIKLTGGQLNVDATTSLDNATVTLAGTLASTDQAATGAVLTLGPNLTINQTTGVAAIRSAATAGSGLVLQGVLSTTANVASVLNIAAPTLTSTGAITLAASDTINFNNGAAGGTVVTLAGGSFNVGAGTTILGGVIVDAASRLLLQGGTTTFDGVAYQGVLNLTLQNTTANFVDGVAFGAVGGVGSATINLTGAGTLESTGVETFDNATVNMGGSQNGVSEIFANDSIAKGGGVLTLGPNFIAQQVAGRTLIASSGLATDGVINKGVINANAGASMAISPAFFTNQGVINAGAGLNLDVSATVFTNAGGGQLNASGGATVSIDGTGGWSNAGVISETGATLNLGGKFATAGIGAVTRAGGVVNITGVLDNTGATVAFGAGAGATVAAGVNLSGTIKNGVIQSTAGGLTGSVQSGGGFLDGVTYQGVLDMTTASEALTIVDGVTFAGAGGVGAATINLTGSSAVLNTKGNETLDNATLNIGSAAGAAAVLEAYDPYAAGTVTTLGSQFVVQQAGLAATLDGTDIGANGFLNQGAINAGVAGGKMTLMSRQSGGATGGVFTNAGSIAANNGDTIEIGASTFANTGTVSATTGATITIDGTKNWTNGGQISETGGTLNLGGNFTSAALAGISRTGGVVNLTGVLDNSNATSAFGAGSAIGAVNLSGTIKHGLVTSGAGGLAGAGGTLDGVTYQGVIDLTAASAQLTLTNGIAISGPGGAGGSAINITGAGSALLTNGVETLDNATINLGSASGGPAQIKLLDINAIGASLTLGAGVTVQQSGVSAQIESADWVGDVITSKGVINAGVAGGAFIIGVRQNVPGGTFINAGAINVSSTDLVDIGQKTFQNTGAISVSAGASLYIDGLGAWSNSGTIVDTGGTMILGSAFTTASLAGVSRTGGTVTLSGALDNTGAVLNVGAGTQLGSLIFKGSVTGGVIADAGGGLISTYSTLTNVAYQGLLDLSAYTADVTITKGISFAGVGGGGQGQVNLTGWYSTIDVKGNVTLDNAVIDIGSATSATIFNDDGAAAGGSTLTLGANLNVVQTGAYASIVGSVVAGDSVVNNGTISAAVVGGFFDITPLKFTNNGALIVGAGETLNLKGAHLTNIVGGALTGGVYQASGGGFIQLANDTLITILQADVTETGATAAVRSLVTATNTQRNIDSTLTAIGASGALRLLGARSMTTAGAFSIGGVLQLGGGTVTSSALTESATGAIVGNGVIASSIADAGVIEAKGGLLELSGAVTGAGHLQIDAGATLELASGAVDQEGVAFAGSNGVLLLDAPASYTGVITAFGATETIDLANTLATGATLSGTTMTVNLAGGGTQTYVLATALPGMLLKTSSDGKGGTLVQDLYPDNFATATVTPAPVAGDTPTTIDFGHQHVGATLSEALVVTNTAVVPAEALDATISGVSGAATAAGSVALLASGQTDSTHLSVGLNSSVAGAQAGSVTIGLSSDGAGPGGGNGLGVTALQSQSIAAQGVFYRYAVGVASPLPANIVVHVGDTLNETITVANTAVADAYSEGLDVSILGASAGLSAAGSVTDLGAGAADTTSLTVGVSTAASGLVAGSVRLGLVSDGAGTSNLANTNEGSTQVAVGATVDNYALAAFASAMGGVLTLTGPDTYTLDLGQVLHGSAPVTATFGVTNAAVGLADVLSGSFVNSGDGALSVGGLGAFNGLGAGQSDGALSVTLSAANAGTFHDTLVLESAGSNAAGYSQALGAVTLNIVGTVVYPDAFAAGTITPLGQNSTATSVDFGNQRLGTTIAAGMWVQNTAAAPSEVLDAVVVSATGDAGGVGSVNGLTAGSSDIYDLKAALDSSRVGVHSGTVTFGLTSDGPASPGGGNGVGVTPVGGKTVSLTGTFYREAAVAIATLPANVIVHVGDKLNEAVSVSNTAAADGWSEALDVLVINTSGAATASGSVSLLAAGATDASHLTVGLSTAIAGMISGSVLLAPQSDGAGTSGFTATSIGGVNLAVAAQVDNYAQAAFKAGAGGTLTKTGVNSYSLDLGSVVQGGAALSATFGAGNSAVILSDLLAGSFVNSGSAALTVSGLGAFAGLGAGQADNALKVSLSTANAGSFSDSLTLTNLVGSNASGFTQGLSDVTVTITGKVLSPGQATINTPQPLNLGNHHVGDIVAPVALSISNTAPNNGASLALDASLGALPFAVTGAGTISMLTPGATDAASLTLGVSTVVSGGIAGSATVKFASDNGMIQSPLASQTVAVTGGVYAYANPILATSLNLGATRVGKAIASSFSVADGAFPDLFQEGLAYTVGAAPAGFTLGGAAGGAVASGKTAPVAVTLSATTSGVFSGSVSLGLTSDGLTADGLAVTPLAPQSVAVTGKVYAAATAQVASTMVNFGAIHVGGATSQSLQITNTASGALVDTLTSGFTTLTDPNFVFGANGSLGAGGLAAGGAGSLGFTFSSSLPGQFTGSAGLSLSSHDGDLADMKVAAPSITLTGRAYALAKPILSGSTTLNFGAVRTSGVVSGLVLSVADGAAASAYQERLAYSVSALPAGYLLGGGASGTVAAGTPKLLTFALNTAVAGDYTNRSVALSLTSTGVGTSGLADTALTPVTITLSGKVYKAAAAKLGATTLAFGVVHVGDVVSAKSLAVTNSAVGALTDTLVGGFGLVSGPFNGVGSLGTGLAAGAAGALGVSLTTAASGVFSGAAALTLTSHDPDLADVSVSAAPVTLTATVDNYAIAALTQVGGAGVLTPQGANYMLNLGTIAQNSGTLSTQIEAINSASGLSDLLAGAFTKAGSTAFTNTTLTAFSGLAAGKATGPITISLASTASGTFSETITLSTTGSNASGYKGALTPETLTITGTVLAPKGSYTLTTGKDTIAAANNNDTITGVANTLTATDSIDGGAGVNTLALVGGGVFDLRAPTKLTNIQMLNVMDGQFTSNPLTNHQQVAYLRDGLDLTVNVAPDLNANPALITFDSIVIHGAANNDVIKLSSGIDTVYLGSAGESVVGGGGLSTVISTAAFAGAAVQGGGHTTLEITDGGAASLNAADANLTIQLDKATTLAVHGGTGITIGGDATVKNALVGATASLDQLSVQNFATGNETLDLTDLGFGAATTIGFAANAGGTGGVLSLGDGVHSASVTLFGQFLAADFHSASDGAGGTMISYVPPVAGGAMAMATPMGH